MPSAQDHKRAYDHDEGPNTGGMGAFSPSRFYTDDIAAECMETIFSRPSRPWRRKGRPFKGVLYFGLMLTPKGPRVIEYNARFGDPETQAVLSRLDTDLFDIFNAVIDESSRISTLSGQTMPPAASAWRPAAIRKPTKKARRSPVWTM